MPPSPLDDRVVVALSRPVRPQDLNLGLDSGSLGSAAPGRGSRPPVIAAAAVVSLKAANLTYMPSSSGSARALNCGCSSASCCTVATYDKDNQAQTQAIAAGSATTAIGTSTACPANQMVNNNENSGPLSPSGGAGSPVSGTPKQLASIKIIYPNDLAKKMTKCKSHLPSQGPVIIDCRPFMEYNKSHIQGAVHINCADKISRRRLQQGKITVLDLISCREGKDSFKRIFSKEIIVYDENTNEPSRVMPSQPLHIVLESLKREGKEPLVLKGGLSSFKQNHENLCDNSLQLQECPEAGGGASAASSALPQGIPTTPDIENAELTPILPFLFLGNEQDAQDLDAMQRLNIGYVINVTTHLPLYHYEKGLFNYKRLPATDSNKQNLRQYFEEAFEFIDFTDNTPKE
ncbi:dual specificity protein phosphatase 10 isoform X2 [Dasypus novemcinctus]|uniref:dual specificity protein phosphatase 10 isoform X2 n=1 Tax=Dasypus novemcinctus TaxID=9361 RepID=UPI0026602AFD|nr:dual specificity protein phosphatase 10 isoform X3 [Dasypus novemcinctus]